MAKRLTHEHYKQWLADNRPDITVLESYRGANTKIMHRCPKGHGWPVQPANVKMGRGCRVCANESRRRPRKWTPDLVRADALNYEYRTDWQTLSGSAYRTAIRMGIIDECCAHMATHQNPSGYWTRARCVEEAKAFPNISVWQSKSSGSYQSARRNDWMDDCTAHMDRGVGGFDPSKPGMLYIITHWFKPEGDSLSKVLTNIGITNRTPWERYSKKDQETFDVIYAFESDDGAAVFELEQKLISHFSYCRNEEGLNLERKKGTREAFDVLPSDVIFMAQHYVGQLNTSRKAA